MATYKFSLEVDAPEFNKTDKFESHAFAQDILEHLFSDARSSCLMSINRYMAQYKIVGEPTKEQQAYLDWLELKISTYDKIQQTIKVI
jgi:hypothetical protein